MTDKSKELELIDKLIVTETYSYRCCICLRYFKDGEVDDCLEDY